MPSFVIAAAPHLLVLAVARSAGAGSSSDSVKLLAESVLPEDGELDALVRKFRALGSMTYAWRLKGTGLLSRTELRLLERCWRVARQREVPRNVQQRCRSLLLFHHGLADSQGLHPDKCNEWAFLAIPDRVLLYDELMGPLGTAGIRSGFVPPLLRRRGGIVFEVGGNTKALFAESDILPWQPRQLHIFEPVPRYFARLRQRWRHRQNTTLHCYGLGEEARDAAAILAGSGTSLFHELQFSGHRLYLDSVGDAEHGRHRNVTAAVEIREAAGVWLELGVDRLALLDMNCEGCEYEVVPALASAGLLARVEVLNIAEHFVVDDIEANTCDRKTGTCAMQAALLGIDRYCKLRATLSRTHRRTWGLPLHAERWELLPRELRWTSQK